MSYDELKHLCCKASQEQFKYFQIDRFERSAGNYCFRYEKIWRDIQRKNENQNCFRINYQYKFNTGL